MHWLQGLDPVVIYAVIAVLSLLESAALTGLVIPGDTALLVAAAVLAESGGSPVILVLAAASGAIVGDSIGYEIGRALRHRDHGRLRRLVASPSWTRAESLVDRHGALSIVGGRFLAVVRTIVPVVAGSSGMRYRRFLGANVVGALAWATLHVTVGTLAADSLSSVEGASRWITIAVVAALAAVVAVRMVRRRAQHPTPVAEAADAVVDPIATATVAITAGSAAGSSVPEVRSTGTTVVDVTDRAVAASAPSSASSSVARNGRCDRARSRRALATSADD